MEIKIKGTSQTIINVMEMLKTKFTNDQLEKYSFDIEEIPESKTLKIDADYNSNEPINFNFPKIT